MGRYDRNGIFSQADMQRLKKSHIGVIGSGGLGGYVMEMLARVGIGALTVVDGDVFDETNLNRQLLSTMTNIGKTKVAEAKKRIELVNPEVDVYAIHTYAKAENIQDILTGVDLVIDALDSISARKMLQEACEIRKIPMVHGAIGGWYGQVTTIMPGDRTLDRLYREAVDAGIEDALGNPSFTPTTIASIQVSEAIKVLIEKGEILQNQVLMVDLLDHEFHIITI